MPSPDPLRAYLKELQRKYAGGVATEHTHRPALQRLIEALEPGIEATNEPKRIECGAPDFIITRAGIPIGYIEAKDIGTALSQEERSGQVRRYRNSLHNLILTDYLEFRWYVNGEYRDTARLGAVSLDGTLKGVKGGFQSVADLFDKFLAEEVPTVGQPRELAQRMATMARMVRDLIEETFSREGEHGPLHAQLEAFQTTLIPDLNPAQFADMYAQTIAYGLFAARVRLASGYHFTRQDAAWNLPRTNPFLRDLFNEIAGPNLDSRIAWLVDDLARLLARADMAEILRDFGRRTRQEDPMVHFYETFLSAYDPRMRKSRGVYYTPEPVVSYIVRSIDYLIKTRFNRPTGLADTNTLILDPAAGTATFLYFVIQHIYDTLAAMGQAGGWNNYVEMHLLPRLFGFELLMAPYAVAHMKLGVLLQETGYTFSGDQRLGIYLTNTLEEAITRAYTMGFARFITEEANAAAEVKRDKQIMVVLGNPPYSVSSVNRGEHIKALMERYKAAVRSERNIQPLSDDYIKFIRFAHDRIERTGYGVIGMITNHAYLAGLIHRGMREELMKSFDEIYLLNLHGSALLGETAPDGGPDENVFDIRQGVAIILAVKRTTPTSEITRTSQVYYADLWGPRQGKYRYLLENDVSATDWQRLEPGAPYFFFVPKDFDLLSEYERGWSVSEIFPLYSTGFATHRDHFAIDFSADSLQERVAGFRDSKLSDDEVRERFNLPDTRDWKLPVARQSLQKDPNWQIYFAQCLYRPFDERHIFYSSYVVEYPRLEVMKHLQRQNLGIATCRIIKGEEPCHIFVTKRPTEKILLSPKTSNNAFVFPLYLYNHEKKNEPVKGGGNAVTRSLFEARAGYSPRDPNLAPAFIATVKEKLGLDFVPDGKGDLQTTFGPEDVFHYAYAVFHSPTYRARYAEFLKIDFPRLPLTSDRELFKTLAGKGEELVALHLMKSPTLNTLITRFPVAGSNEVTRVNYVAPHQDAQGNPVPGRVYINREQYFEGSISPEVWEFHVGGYQVLHKWLKARTGRKLSFDDLLHYQKVVVALKETIRLMDEIDQAIPAWPIE